MKQLFSFFLLICSFHLTIYSQLENLGSQINSKYSEISPYITPDGSNLFFIRENHPENTLAGETQDVWWCKLEDDSLVSTAKHLTFPFNTIEYNSINFQSADGQVRMIKGVFDKYGMYVKKGYSYMTMTTEGWSNPVALNINYYDKMAKGKYVGMCIAPSGNVMILSFSQIKDHNKSELYMSKRISDKKWTKPQKIKGSLDGDFAPFIASDNKTMYFSSYARGGFGDADIFVTKRLDDTWLNWSEPINLGDKINTADWDAYFKVSPSGKYAYMVSGVGGNSDLYRLPLFSKDSVKEQKVIVEAAKPDPVIIVEGNVLDADNQKPLTVELEYKNLETNKIEGIARSSVVDGTYKVVLPYGSNYAIGAKLQGYYSEDIHLDLSQIGEFTTLKRDVLMRPIKNDVVIRLNNIFFELGKANLLPTSQNELDHLVTILNENPNMIIEIRGHTDNQGGTELNQVLSENRAKSVVDYLISKKINSNRLSSKGFGESSPAVSNDTQEGKAFNRRVEFKIISVK